MKSKNVRLPSDVNQIKQVISGLTSSFVLSGILKKSVSKVLSKIDFEFDRYQGFYTYQWKVNHCIL